MSINYFIELLGGLALFLYGMAMMSKGLELAAGDKLRVIIEKMTSNFFKAILVGVIVTAIIQSSSATTVMVVGFVNAGLMNIYQAVGIIMGGKYRYNYHRSTSCSKYFHHSSNYCLCWSIPCST